MDKLVNLVCVGSADCPKGCEGDCSIFKLIADDLQKFSNKVSIGLAGREIVIAKLRLEDWYGEAVSGLLGIWAQK